MEKLFPFLFIAILLISCQSSSSQNGGLVVNLINKCPAGSSTWHVKVERVSDQYVWQYDLPAGAVQPTLRFPAGKYYVSGRMMAPLSADRLSWLG
jgi:heme/copper-type cytochrome/quinol oxidase subunit 2